GHTLMDTNYWTRHGAAIRHGFIQTTGPNENYWTRQPRLAWFVRAQTAMRLRARANLGRAY
ncbi:MAG TPA: hypothetical protein VK821_09460, partial [Dehalococcoidia bacterium]|nr:hypothetical protein [Dehalococcoidia bacterium]